MAKLLEYFAKNSDMSKEDALVWGTGIVLGVFLDSVISSPVFQGLMHVGMKIRVGCCSLIYRKILKVSKVSIERETSIGQVRIKLMVYFSSFLSYK